jgi:hypothetical protein
MAQLTRIQVELLPPIGHPSIFRQDFEVSSNPAHWQIDPETSERYTSAKVTQNRGTLVNDEGETIEFAVPVMLFYETTPIRITASRGNNQIWRAVWAFQLPPEYRQRRPIPDCIKVLSANEQGIPQQISCSKRAEDIVKESQHFGPEQYVGFNHVDPNVRVAFGISKATQPNGEVLTYYMGRVFALTTIVIYLSEPYYQRVITGRGAEKACI